MVSEARSFFHRGPRREDRFEQGLIPKKALRGNILKSSGPKGDGHMDMWNIDTWTSAHYVSDVLFSNHTHYFIKSAQFLKEEVITSFKLCISNLRLQ